VRTRLRYAAGVGVLSTGILISGIPAGAALADPDGASGGTASDSGSSSSSTGSSTSGTASSSSDSSANTSADAGTDTDTSDADAREGGKAASLTLDEQAANSEAETNGADDAAAAPTETPAKAEILASTHQDAPAASGGDGIDNAPASTISSPLSTTTSTSTATTASDQQTATSEAQAQATAAEVAKVAAAAEQAAAPAAVPVVAVAVTPILDVFTAVQTVLTAFLQPGTTPGYIVAGESAGGATAGGLRTGAALLLPAAAAPAWMQVAGDSALPGAPNQLTNKSGLLLEPSKSAGSDQGNLIQRLGNLVEGLGSPAGSSETPMGPTSVLTKAITGVLVSVSIWALLSAALPGLGGLAFVGAAGVGLGYRQAKFGFLVRTSGSARFLGSGPLGVVRSGSFIDLRARPTRKPKVRTHKPSDQSLATVTPLERVA
jgi:hypothetical protein